MPAAERPPAAGAAASPAAPGDPLAALLAGTYPDPETGAPLGAEARAVVIEDSLDGAERELVAAHAPGRRVALLADATTYAVLGARVARALDGPFAVERVVLDAPYADAATVRRIVDGIDARTDLVIAVGAGTLNDLGKMVALARGCPQLVFATAPSMNGFTSVSASITRDGVKRSIRARTPVAALFDLRVLAAAPARLVRAGLGDSLCRPTAQVDWLMAHLLRDGPYRAAPFALLAVDEAALLADPRALLAGELPAMRHLVRTLVLSGFGMTICGGSFPASQGEHLLSHYLEMRQPPGRPLALHGEQIGVCTLAMAALQDHLLARDAPPVMAPTRVGRAELVAHWGEATAEVLWAELAPKRLDREAADALTARLARTWDDVRARLAGCTPGAAALRGVLEAAGALTQPAALGCDAARFADALAHAREVRNRYTFLDLAADAVDPPSSAIA